jgi:hypothetical protein
VYAEIGEDGVIDGASMSGKARELEFDSLGRTVYQISSYSDGYYPFAEYGRGSKLEFSEYNDQNLRTYFCTESFQMISEHFSSFDLDGNLILSESIHSGKGVTGHDKRSFEWKRGKMIESNWLLSEDDQHFFSEFDSKGRCIKTSFGNSKMTLNFETSGDTVSKIQTYTREDSLVSTETWSELKGFAGQYVYSSKQNHKGELEFKREIDYDEFGNPTSYYSAEYIPETINEDGSYVFKKPSKISIFNFYDEHGFLVRQEFFKVDFESDEKQLVKIYRFVYEKTPLRFKFEKGELRKKEIELHENYGPDY